MPDPVDATDPALTLPWRKVERERLIAARLALPAEERQRHGYAIARLLLQVIGDPAGLVVSAYWPFRGEPDLRPFLEEITAQGGQAALPVVVAKGAPLVFRLWRRGEALERGVWNIPIPAADAPVAMPQVVIAPVVGFDAACYRLGYGGGFYDRTLAAMPVKPRILGVGYNMQAIDTVHPLPHDIPMDVIITETGILAPKGGDRT